MSGPADGRTTDSRTALLVIDVQVNQVEDWPVLHAPAMLAGIVALVERARAAGVPVVFVQNDGGDGEPDLPGTPGWALHPALGCRPEEAVVRKTTTDSFHETGLAELLAARGIDRLVICGFQTDWCINATVRRAAAEGYATTLVSDLHSTMDQGREDPAVTIERHNRELGALVTLLEAAAVTF